MLELLIVEAMMADLARGAEQEHLRSEARRLARPVAKRQRATWQHRLGWLPLVRS